MNLKRIEQDVTQWAVELRVKCVKMVLAEIATYAMEFYG